jgi:four helix bundle protein
MNPNDFKSRTKGYALRIIRLVESLPSSRVAVVIGNQLVRAGTSVGANYRAASRAKSRADFISKMGTVEEECDESLYWIELLIESQTIKPELVSDLMREGTEILALTVASARTARSRDQLPSRILRASGRGTVIRNPQSAIRNSHHE